MQALVTGEALGQVSSQTLTNLRLIDNVSDTLILRPLISHDKEHIIDLAREIGTEDFARTMPEYCGVISKSPTVKAVKAKIEAEEEHFDFSILDKVVEEASNIDIREIAQQTEETVVEVETVTGFGANDAILDIRSIDEQEDKPLKVEGLRLFPAVLQAKHQIWRSRSEQNTAAVVRARGDEPSAGALFARAGLQQRESVSPVTGCYDAKAFPDGRPFTIGRGVY